LKMCDQLVAERHRIPQRRQRIQNVRHIMDMTTANKADPVVVVTAELHGPRNLLGFATNDRFDSIDWRATNRPPPLAGKGQGPAASQCREAWPTPLPSPASGGGIARDAQMVCPARNIPCDVRCSDSNPVAVTRTSSPN